MNKKTRLQINQDTFDIHVCDARALAQRHGITKSDVVFPEVELQMTTALHDRVLALVELFKIGASVLDSKARAVDLNLNSNWMNYPVEGLAQRARKYVKQNVYYARAFHEVISIAVATADSFLGLMEAPVSMSFAPNMQIHGADAKGKSITWIAAVKTTAEAYHHARFEFTACAFLKRLQQPCSMSVECDLHQHEIHKLLIQALEVMSAAAAVAKIYSTKKWVVCKD